jgi:hypothetical protein
MGWRGSSKVAVDEAVPVLCLPCPLAHADCNVIMTQAFRCAGGSNPTKIGVVAHEVSVDWTA